MASQFDVQDSRVYLSAVIAAGQSLSGVVDFGGLTPIGIVMPATWVAAALTFQTSTDGVNFQELRTTSGDSAVSITVSQGSNYLIGISAALSTGADAHWLKAYRYWKFRSGTSGAPVVQTSGATVTVVALAMA